MNAARSAMGVMLCGAAALSAAGAVRWRSAFSSAAIADPIPSNTPTESGIDSVSIDSSVAMLVANDPFRFSNTPPSVRFSTANDAPGAAVAVAAARPRLVLKAIVGGPPWSAVIDGLPGQPMGAVVQTGNRFEQLTISAVTRDSVVIRGADTTWVLHFGGRS